MQNPASYVDKTEQPSKISVIPNSSSKASIASPGCRNRHRKEAAGPSIGERYRAGVYSLARQVGVGKRGRSHWQSRGLDFQCSNARQYSSVNTIWRSSISPTNLDTEVFPSAAFRPAQRAASSGMLEVTFLAQDRCGTDSVLRFLRQTATALVRLESETINLVCALDSKTSSRMDLRL
jgi:hypothetical protein